MELDFKKPKINFNYKDNCFSNIDKTIKKDSSSKSSMIMVDQSRGKLQQNSLKKSREPSNGSLNDKNSMFDNKKYVRIL